MIGMKRLFRVGIGSAIAIVSACGLIGCFGAPPAVSPTSPLYFKPAATFAIQKTIAQPTPKPKLYVAEATLNKVLVFDPTVPNPTPQATITKGLSAPFGLAVDRNANLYVANSGDRTVTVYHPGKSTPFFKIDHGLGSVPEAIAVDSTGNVFVTTAFHHEIVAFHPGHQHAYQTFRIVKGRLGALAFDVDDNLYIAADKYVLEIPRGTTKPIDLGLSGLSGADGIAFANGIMYVSNFALNDVAVYKKGQTAPFRTITSGFDQPTFNTFVQPAELFQVNNIDWKVEGFKRDHSNPFVTITGLTRPIGVAASPLQNP